MYSVLLWEDRALLDISDFLDWTIIDWIIVESHLTSWKIWVLRQCVIIFCTLNNTLVMHIYNYSFNEKSFSLNSSHFLLKLLNLLQIFYFWIKSIFIFYTYKICPLTPRFHQNLPLLHRWTYRSSDIRLYLFLKIWN